MHWNRRGPLLSHLPNPQDRAITAPLSCIYLLSAMKTASQRRGRGRARTWLKSAPQPVLLSLPPSRLSETSLLVLVC